jgi:hypothetical protein
MIIMKWWGGGVVGGGVEWWRLVGATEVESADGDKIMFFNAGE